MFDSSIISDILFRAKQLIKCRDDVCLATRGTVCSKLRTMTAIGKWKSCVMYHKLVVFSHRPRFKLKAGVLNLPCLFSDGFLAFSFKKPEFASSPRMVSNIN